MLHANRARPLHKLEVNGFRRGAIGPFPVIRASDRASPQRRKRPELGRVPLTWDARWEKASHVAEAPTAPTFSMRSSAGES